MDRSGLQAPTPFNVVQHLLASGVGLPSRTPSPGNFIDGSAIGGSGEHQQLPGQRNWDLANKGISVFFKCGETVRKCHFRGDNLCVLRELFLKQFPDMARRFTDTTLPPFTIVHKESRIVYEVETLTDLYPYCVLEVKLPKPPSEAQASGAGRRDASVGYFAFQKQKLCFVMVGLPARGKSYISRKICRYLSWVGVPRAAFNVGSYRRARLGSQQSSNFFDPANEDGNRARLHMAIAALDDMLNWLNQGGKVAIYDATNSTNERRQMILDRCSKEGVQVVFIESICNDQTIIERSIQETKLSMPDYQGMNPDAAVQDFRNRIANYEKTYETVGDEVPYVKLIDVGRQVVVNRIESYVASRVIHFLMNLHTVPRPIWITRHGQSEFNTENRIGGDSALTAHGDDYAHALADWVESHITQAQGIGSLTIWTSTLKRSIGTAQYINHPKLALRVLDEIDAGLCDGLSYDEMAEQMPDEFSARAADKLRYRYPKGESYQDVCARLEPVIFELERQKNPVLIVSHVAVIRALTGYFMDIPLEELPYIPVQSDCVYEFLPKAYGCTLNVYKPFEHLKKPLARVDSK